MTIEPFPRSTRPSDAAILASMAATLRAVLHDDGIDEIGGFLRTSVVQAIALAEHACRRGPDPARDRFDELSAALDSLVGNELVARHWPGDPYVAASGVLVAAVGRTDDDADQARAVIRPILVAHLDADLSATPALLDAFRGRLRDA